MRQCIGRRAGRLERLVRGRNTSQKVVLRAKVVLLSADGVPTSEIMERLETTYPTITRCRRRYAESRRVATGPDHLRDEFTCGRESSARVAHEPRLGYVHRSL